ncbi:MAG: SCP2 sterol-binding domain-containing protein [Cyclobacteriaceae bacterium]
MTLEEATAKVQSMASDHGGRFGSKANFKFDEGIIHLDDSVSPAVVNNNEADADCTFKMTISTFEKLISGDVNPMMAFMTGKMKIDGDKGVAMKLSSLF